MIASGSMALSMLPLSCYHFFIRSHTISNAVELGGEERDLPQSNDGKYE
jgi:hypothetical protein